MHLGLCFTLGYTLSPLLSLACLIISPTTVLTALLLAQLILLVLVLVALFFCKRSESKTLLNKYGIYVCVFSCAFLIDFLMLWLIGPDILAATILTFMPLAASIALVLMQAALFTINEASLKVFLNEQHL